MLRFFVKQAPVDPKPSFVRTVSSFYLVFAVLFGLAWITGASTEHSRVPEAVIGLIIVPAALGTFIWFFFVPRRLEFSNTEITIKPALENLRTLDWHELEYFGPGRGVFVLQFYG